MRRAESLWLLTLCLLILLPLEVATAQDHYPQGLIFPVGDQSIVLTSAEISITGEAWTCMALNIDFHVFCSYELTNRSDRQASPYLVFPFTTHNIFGDHQDQEFFEIAGRDPLIVVGPLGELFLEVQDGSSHPLFENAVQLASISTDLPATLVESIDMAAVWQEEFGPDETKRIEIAFTHFSGFGCNHPMESAFTFDTTNSVLWRAQFPITVLVEGEGGDVSTSLLVEPVDTGVRIHGTCNADPITVEIETVSEGYK